MKNAIALTLPATVALFDTAKAFVVKTPATDALLETDSAVPEPITFAVTMFDPAIVEIPSTLKLF